MRILLQLISQKTACKSIFRCIPIAIALLRSLILQKKGQNAPRLTLSFFKLDVLPLEIDEGGDARMKLVQQAIIRAQLSGQTISAETIAGLPEEKKVIFMSKALEGPLERMQRVAGRPRERSITHLD